MSEVKPSEGLRARKQRETRSRISEAGLQLFLTNGFDATTLDMIAAAADISRRSFFHYFDSKEAVLLAWETEVEVLFKTAIAEQPDRATPLALVRAALADVISHYETKQARAINDFMLSTESLRTRKQAGYERLERVIYSALVERWPAPARQGALRLVAMAAIGALRLAVEKMNHDEFRQPVSHYLDDAFATLMTELTA